MMNPVAVIGAGITGLVAAFRLQQKKIPVVLYEATGRAGGVIQSVRDQGYLAEFGPNTLLDTSPKLREIIKGAGLEPRMMYSDEGAGNRYLVRNRKTIAMPATPVGFFRSELFSWRAKLMLFREPFVRRWDNRYEESVAQFVIRRLGREFLDYAIDALVAGIYAGDPFRLSVIHGFPRLHALEQRYGSMIKGQILGARERKRRAEVSKQDAKKISFDEGLQVLPDTLLKSLGAAARINTPVTRLRMLAEGWEVEFQNAGAPQKARHSGVLLAAPAHQIARLQIEGSTLAPLATLGRIHYPPVASVVLGFRREDVNHALDGFGMLIPKVEQFNILGALFSSSLFPNRAPAGHVTITSYVGGMRNPALAAKPPGELYELTARDLGLLLGITGRPTFRHCVIYDQAIPQYEVGYGQYKQVMDDLEQAAPGLYFAGHYRHGISLGDSMVSAYDVADRIEQNLKRGPERPAAA